MWVNQHLSHPEAISSSFPIRNYIPRHADWPYKDNDFTRSDESPDTQFYDQPRYVAHIDDAALARLTEYYEAVLPRKGRILDLCTSWRSWYPVDCEKGVCMDKTLEVFGIGLNEAEMERNPLLHEFPERYATANLNEKPYGIKSRWPNYDKGNGDSPTFDCVTCAVSIDYLARPIEVLKSVRECTVEHGSIHLIISNRCFPTKVVNIWMRLTEDERLQLVGDYLHFSGWKAIEIVDLCPQDESRQYLDPLWVVRATKKM